MALALGFTSILGGGGPAAFVAWACIVCDVLCVVLFQGVFGQF